MDKTTCNASTVQEELGLVKPLYATEYMTKYMKLQNSKKYKGYRKVQQTHSWREWQLFVFKLTKKQEARLSGQPHTKRALLTLPNEVFMMIFRFAFYGYAKFLEHV